VAETETRPLLDKLGVKPGSKVALVDIGGPALLKLLRGRTSDITEGKPKSACDIVIMGAGSKRDLEKLRELKTWIEPNGAIWVVRAKGKFAVLKDTDLIEAGLAAGLVDNKIASFSDSHGAMRFVFRLRDRPR
jgi:hypothetical protein